MITRTSCAAWQALEELQRGCARACRLPALCTVSLSRLSVPILNKGLHTHYKDSFQRKFRVRQLAKPAKSQSTFLLRRLCHSTPPPKPQHPTHVLMCAK